jgi:hypothetical protein
VLKNAPMDVTILLEPKIDLERLAEVLDGLGHEGRVHATRTWTRKQKKALFEAAKGFKPIDLDFAVPSSVGNLVEVVHVGHNTTGIHPHFEKRMTKLEGEDAPIYGFNEQSLRMFSGPGYFAVTKGEGEREGELVFDYDKVPKQKPDHWPKIEKNDGFISGIVNGGMTDYLRALSSHVSIGEAFKNGKHRGFWFTLVRKDVS